GRGGGAGAAARQRAALPRDAARAAGVAGAPGRAGARHRGGVRIGAPYLARVRLRGLVPQAADPLDVVASVGRRRRGIGRPSLPAGAGCRRSEEHTSELQSLAYLVCRLLLEKKTEKS